jgi:hypothetical protein
MRIIKIFYENLIILRLKLNLIIQKFYNFFKLKLIFTFSNFHFKFVIILFNFFKYRFLSYIAIFFYY